MSTMKARRFVAVSIVAAALALVSIGSTGVSASKENDDDLGAQVTAPVAQHPFAYGNSVTSIAPAASSTDPNAFADYGNHDR